MPPSPPPPLQIGHHTQTLSLPRYPLLALIIEAPPIQRPRPLDELPLAETGVSSALPNATTETPYIQIDIIYSRTLWRTPSYQKENQGDAKTLPRFL